MDCNTGKEIIIRGVTSDGRTFRPSNWAERIAGVMSQFRPRPPLPGDHITYSPWCMPGTDGNVRCLVVSPHLKQKYPEAWEYIEQFAQENGLQIQERAITAHGG